MSRIARAEKLNFQTRGFRSDFGLNTATIRPRVVENSFDHGIPAYKGPTNIILSEVKKVIRQDFSLSDIHLRFDYPKGVTILAGEGTMVDIMQGKFISRCFNNAGIASLTLPEEFRWSSDGLRSLKDLLDLAEQEKVNELKTLLDTQSFDFIIGKTEQKFDLIPGQFKYYTTKRTLPEILAAGMIKAGWNRKGGDNGFFVSVSRLSLAPELVRNILFTPDEVRKKPGKGEAVVGFDLPEGSSLTFDCLGSDKALEYWTYGNLHLPDVRVAFAGKNPLSY